MEAANYVQQTILDKIIMEREELKKLKEKYDQELEDDIQLDAILNLGKTIYGDSDYNI